MAVKLNNQKIAAVIREHKKWIIQHSNYTIPLPEVIRKKLRIPYERWYSGITKYSDDTRLLQHLNKNDWAGIYFKIMDTGTMQQANKVEAHFSNLGTKNSPHKAGATLESIYSYIFKADANLAEKVVILLNK